MTQRLTTPRIMLIVFAALIAASLACNGFDFSAPATDEPTDEPTEAPTDEPTEEATDEPTEVAQSTSDDGGDSTGDTSGGSTGGSSTGGSGEPGGSKQSDGGTSGGSTSGGTSGGTTGGSTGGSNLGRINLTNDSTEPICFVYISPTNSSNWGNDWLGADIIQPGVTWWFETQYGAIDMKAEACDHEIMDAIFDYNLTAGGTYNWSVNYSRPQGTAMLYLNNNSPSESVCWVYITPDSSSGWSGDWLGSGVVAAGDTWQFEIDAGTYDLQAEACDGTVIDTQYGQTFNPGSTANWDVYYDPAPPPSGDTLLLGGTPSFGHYNLNGGFSPDPMEYNMTSGGSVDTSYLSGCTGYAAINPDITINYNGIGALTFFFISSGDTTLIINDPGGSWYCADDTFGTINPTIVFPLASSGLYEIWVGSYDANAGSSGTLYVTELPYDPSNYP